MLVLKDLQKKFGKQHILQHITHTFNTGSKTVVLGSNGSGKSTLIKILSGALEATDAPPVANIADREIPASELGQYCTIAAPYVALNPMFSLAETLAFHQDFCPFLPSFDSKLWVEKAGLTPHLHKRLSTFSSGMQQRVRLMLAIGSDRPLLLLDEPTNNLDKEGVEFYQDLMQQFTSEKTVVVASNYVEVEYAFCTDQLILEKHY